MGFRRFLLQVWALIVKRWILLRRQYTFLFGFFLIPLLLEIIAVAAVPPPKEIEVSIIQNRRYPDAQMPLVPSIYNPQTVVTYTDNNGNNVQTRLRSYLNGMNVKIEEISSNTVLNYVQSRWNQTEDIFINRYQMSFSLSNNLTASSPSLILDTYFSTVNYHTIASSLSAATTNLFQFYANSSAKAILAINQPLMITGGNLTGLPLFFQSIFCFDTIPVALFNFINGAIASIFISLLALNMVRERHGRSKNLQLLTGLSKFTYWFSNALCDWCLCLIFISLLVIIVKVRHAKRNDAPLNSDCPFR